MKMYLIYDVETGGLDEKKHSLLTLTLRVVDQQLQKLAELDLKLKADDNVYRTNVEALKINKINLISHDTTAISYKEAKSKILNFLNKYSENGNRKLTPVGHNISFDDNFIQTHIMTREEWEQHVSYKKLDTATIAEFFKYALLIPGHLSSSLSELAEFFGVKESGAHNSQVDVNMTNNLLRAMKYRVSGFTKIQNS